MNKKTKPFTSISWHFESSAHKVNMRVLNALAAKLYRAEQVLAHKKINVVFCSDEYICGLNSEYRHKDKPTDVLSFEFGEDSFFGEIYISTDTADKQAEEYGHSFLSEIQRLFIHGFFHLLGYDHIKSGDRKVMEARESKYLSIK